MSPWLSWMLMTLCALLNGHTLASTIHNSPRNAAGSKGTTPSSAASMSTSEITASLAARSTIGATIIPSPASCLPSFIPPIAIPIHNVTLQGPQGSIIRRGAELSIGTPPQPLAFIISDQTNNTAIFDIHNQCYTDAGANYTKPNSSAAGCFSYYGGAFNESKSSTWTNSTSFAALGVPEDSITWFGPIGYGTDSVALSTNISTSNSPLLIDYGRTGYEAFFMSTIGLGINSTLLNTLVSTGKIASRSWSMFNGFTGSQSQNQSDGILVLGGYDQSKILGSTADNLTLDFNFDADTNDITSCPATGMIVTIYNMTLVWPNGTKAGILASSRSTQLGACIIPNYDYVSVTNDIWNTFVSLTGSEGAGRSNSPLSWFQNLVTAESAFKGDLVISINPGLDITIPNHELVRSFVDINATTGEEYISDSSKRVMGMYAQDEQTSNNIIALGRTFLTGAYLMVDADKQQFTLWKGQSSNEQKLISHGPSPCQDTATPTPPLVRPEASQHDSGLAISKGATAGISVALFSIVAIGAGATYLLIRKLRRVRAARNKYDGQKRKDVSHDSDKLNPFQKSELASDHQVQPPQEMSLGKRGSEAVAPFEMVGAEKFPFEMAAQGRSLEMAANENSAQEICGDLRAPFSPIELPSTPMSRASVKRLPALPSPDTSPSKSINIPNRKPVPQKLDIPRTRSAKSAVSPL